MNKNEFKLKLYEELEGVNTNEKSKILDYFDELIADACDDGMDEESFIDSLGDIQTIVAKVRVEQKIKIAKEKPGISTGTKALVAVLAVCALPIALPVIIALVVALVSIIIALVSIIVALVAGVGGVGVAGIVGLITSIVSIPFGTISGIFGIGLSLIAIGFTLILIVVLVWLIKLLWKTIGSLLNIITGKIYDRRRK